MTAVTEFLAFMNAFGGVLTTLGIFGGAYIALRKLKFENAHKAAETVSTNASAKNIDADTMKTIQDISKSLMETMRQRIEELEKRTELQDREIEIMRTQIDKLELELEIAKRERNAIANGAYALYWQLKSVPGMIPAYTPPEFNRGEDE